MLQELVLQTVEKKGFINITSKIAEIVGGSNIQNGICVVFVLHTTSAIVINEDEPGLKKDIINVLDKLIPEQDFLHNVFDENAKGHIITSLLGQSKTIIIKKGKLKLGAWQSIFFAEFDGPRKNRKVLVQLIEE